MSIAPTAASKRTMLRPGLETGGTTAYHPEITRVLKSAAYAAECPTAVFYASASEAFEVKAWFGASKPGPSSPVLHQAACLPAGEMLVVNDLLLHPDILIVPDSAPAPDRLSDPAVSIRFIAAMPVVDHKGAVQGVLLVADGAGHAGLSAAASYVLQSHAAQLSALLELHALRGLSTKAAAGRSDSERLRLLESVVVNANDAVLITKAEPIDLPGPVIIYCNAAFTRTTGYPEAEVLGRTPRLLQTETTDRTTLDRLRAALRAWKPVEVELLNRKKDGTLFWVELSIAPVANEKGWFTHWVSVQRDVSDRKTAEETATRVRIAEAENIVLAAEIQERKRVEARLLYTAFHDDLTKLYNRAFFMGRLRTALDLVQGDPTYGCAVLFLDLDNFKLINDSLGHRAGDLLLMDVAHRLRGCLHPLDVLARVGGDEFAVLIERLDTMDEIIAVTGGILEAIRRPLWLGDQEVFTSCCVGVLKVTPDHASPEELLRDADLAMYEAKRGDKDGYAIFTASMHDNAVQELELHTDLRNAIMRNEFFLHFQPICDGATARVVGVEALIRWQHPQRGVVSPDGFIPAAEETGLIRTIGRWVLQQSCLQMRAWNEQFPNQVLRLSVNASGVELESPGFVLGVSDTLVASGIDPRNVQIEVTESIFHRQPGLVRRILAEIRDLGVKVALDDFGTGYSSLGYLDRFPIDSIKIDRSFVASMLVRQRTRAIVEGIVKLGQALDLSVIAEGVEEDTQMHALQEIGCDFVQGYLLGRPMPAHQFEAMLRRQDEGRLAAQG